MIACNIGFYVFSPYFLSESALEILQKFKPMDWNGVQITTHRQNMAYCMQGDLKVSQ